MEHNAATEAVPYGRGWLHLLPGQEAKILSLNSICSVTELLNALVTECLLQSLTQG